MVFRGGGAERMKAPETSKAEDFSNLKDYANVIKENVQLAQDGNPSKTVKSSIQNMLNATLKMLAKHGIRLKGRIKNIQIDSSDGSVLITEEYSEPSKGGRSLKTRKFSVDANFKKTEVDDDYDADDE